MAARLAVCACALLSASLAAPRRTPGAAPQRQTKPPEAHPAQNSDPEAELQKAIAGANNDSAAVVRNLKAYLARFPDAPRKAAVYRALVEGCEQIRDEACALQYAEALIAVRPDDSQMMLLAVSLLQRKGDDASLERAAGYVTRILDRLEKETPADKPARESLATWQEGRTELRAALTCVRGRIEISQHHDESAAQDLHLSESIYPNAIAAESLGELAEDRNDPATAIGEYARAFVLPQSGPAGRANREEIRKKLGNVWRVAHGSEQGLGDAILAAYDHLPTESSGAAAEAASRNRNAAEPFAFVLRRMDGTPYPLAPLRGKILVLSFWATWCGPCRELEPRFNQVAESYAGNSEVVFLAVSADDDQTLVPPFVAREKWDVPVVYADGMDRFLGVNTLPAVLILGRAGQIVYRVNGFQPGRFSESLLAAIQGALVASR